MKKMSLTDLAFHREAQQSPLVGTLAFPLGFTCPILLGLCFGILTGPADL